MSMILEIKDLHMSFRSVVGTTRAANGVSLDVQPGEIMGLVGESGCGKSVTARSVVGLVPSPPAVFEGGEIWLTPSRLCAPGCERIHPCCAIEQCACEEDLEMPWLRQCRPLYRLSCSLPRSPAM